LNEEVERMSKTGSTPRDEARKYLERAISRHRRFGGDQTVPKAVYEKALSRTARTFEEFERVGRKATGAS
jgi:hypothetical protein